MDQLVLQVLHLRRHHLGGGDLILAPPQSGEPLNFFVYPYVEVGGKPWSGVHKRFSFRDLEG